MIRKCPWCNEAMGEKEPLSDTRITHGICPTCREVVLGETSQDSHLLTAQAVGLAMVERAMEGL